MHDFRLGVCYDFRNPPAAGLPNRLLYAEILEQVRRLDTLGADLVWFTEHHFVEDGYLPSWTPVAGAMAALTHRVRFSTAICLAPFNHPIRLAEDLAILDNLSDGRIEVGLGMGYAPHEFKGFGIPFRQRVSLMNECIEVLQGCFSGERFSFQGRRYQFEDVQITPGYVQRGGPPMWIAAMSAPGAERAARYATNFLPQGLRKESYAPWVRAVSAAGRDPRQHRVGVIRSVLVTDDRDTDWGAVRAAERYRMDLYRRFHEESGEGFDPRPGQRVPQTWIVGNPDECVQEIVAFARKFAITDMVTMAVPPGLRPEQMAGSLERLFKEVAPQVRAELTTG